ncbi:putative DNA binding domain-containing protein [Bifidobacterium sp. MA2]|uniref:DNA binding domain-containing protein n=1 Tax=Bifidobacterium santillanense TaxID=2809028 RepID=A0ABS5UQD5_9BIFI|nr:ATP-binding protein [Bifidobacterium santillanense]MBT1173166.1 putative DNA binding domain-containing protein [Bifidobacterium santillanense]
MEPEVVLHSLCAFANDINNLGGGYLVIGVDEHEGMPVLPPAGLPKNSLDRIQKELISLCHRIEPLYMPVCEPVEFEGQWLLLIWAPGGYDRPYRAPIEITKKETGKAYYVRRFSNSVRASKSEIEELMDIGGSIPFDDRINYQSSMNDLRIGLMMEHLGKVDSVLAQEELDSLSMALDLRVADGPRENRHPLNVGLMFFNEDPERFFREARIEVVDIPDPTGEGMTERVFHGPLNRQLSDALQYIHNTVLAEKIFKLEDRAEAIRVFNYPYAAVEEALSNAVYHKSYQIPEPITVRIERDRMIILSFPGPDRSISDEDLKKHRLVSRRYRNRRIGDFLKELHLAEGRNTGVPTMLKALRDNGSPPPVFETDEDRTFLSVTFMIHPSFMSDGSEEAQSAGFNPQSAGFNPQSAGFNPQSAGFNPQSAGFNPQSAGFDPQSAGFDPQSAGDSRSSTQPIGLKKTKLAEQQALIITYLRHHDRITSSTASDLLRLQPRRVRLIFNKMQDAGMIQRIGAGRGTYYTLQQQ